MPSRSTTRVSRSTSPLQPASHRRWFPLDHGSRLLMIVAGVDACCPAVPRWTLLRHAATSLARGKARRLRRTLPGTTPEAAGWGDGRTDTPVMLSIIGRFRCGRGCVAAILVAACVSCLGFAESARAGGHHHTAWGQTPPCGATGCGPRYCGEKHEPSCPDPCDACVHWRKHGIGQMPDMLAPWQLPPGRGFQSPQAVGYQSGPCHECQHSCWKAWSLRPWWR